ncbi:MAG: UbiH/UbiF/VisC/COQ6 family ubiquinone biosynthesis hydroxylase [Gammaproteobacteria bacterium]|nr:UbiH/UbiF/VisC/COQ6 family ubiquinone biosynthesis hydroxylase [Gammaproteobacteria bacterium]
MHKLDVLVLGAGMVGASIALVLARKGFKVGVIERQELDEQVFDPQDAIDLRVSAISPSSQQLLTRLGVWPILRLQRVCDYQHMRVWHEQGAAEMVFSSEQMGTSHLGTIVENRLLQMALHQQLSALANASVFSGLEVSAIEQDGDRVQLATNNQQSFSAELLIAADGRNSTAARLLQVPVMAGSYQQMAIVANVNTELPHHNTAWQRFLATGPLAFLPLGNGQSSIVWSADDELAQALLAMPDNEFCQRLGEAFEYRLGRVTATSPRASFPLHWHSAERWLTGRVLLIGDAAHGVHPLAGQGVNLGFGDVALLDRLLGAGEPVFQPRLLRRFERQRKAETVTATHLFTALKQLYAQTNPLLCLARDVGMSVVEKNRLIKRLVMQSAMHNMA